MRTTDVILACVLSCMAGCGKQASPRASESTVASADTAATTAADKGAHVVVTPIPAFAPDAAPPSSSAQANAFHPDDDPACAELSTLTSEIRMWQVAASPQPHRRKAQALWPRLPPACRGGTFYLSI